MPNTGHIFCIFSNLWFYIGSGNNGSDTENITKIKQIHGITKCINLDAKTCFWYNTIAKYADYDPAISAQLQIRNSTQLKECFDNLTNMITALLTKPATLTKLGSIKDHIVLFYTIDTRNSECLLGLYLYYLCKTTGVDITTAIEILKTKIQLNNPAGGSAIIQFSDDMKKFLYLHCGTGAK